MVFLLFHQGKVALRHAYQGPAGRAVGGPNEPAPAQDALAAWGLAGEPAFAGTGTHIFTHVEWRMTALRCALEEDTLPPAGCGVGRGSWRRPMPFPAPSAPFQTLVEEGLE